MKILILSDYFSAEGFGGAGVVAVDEARALKERGHDIHVITVTDEAHISGSEEWNGMKVHRLYSNYSQAWRAYVSLHNYRLSPEIKKILEEVKPDVVHAHNIHTYISYYALKLAKKNGAKVFITMHDVMAVHYGKFTEFIKPKDLSIPETFDFKISPLNLFMTFKREYNPFRNIFIRAYLKYADKIFAVSNIQKQVLEENCIGNVDVLYNALDISKWHVPVDHVTDFKTKHGLHGKKVIFFSGWTTGAKGGDQMFASFVQVAAKVPEAVLLLVGRTDVFFKYIIDRAEKYGLKNRIVSTGLLYGDPLKVAYEASDVVVFPSISFETFGLVCLEAAASKKPIVGSCFGGAVEIIENGKTGYIVNPYNSTDMANKITELLTDKAKAHQFGRAGFERAKEKFDMEDKIDQLLHWYDR